MKELAQAASAGLVRMAESVLVASVFGLFLRAFLLSAVIVESRSMAPTLNPGDRVLVNRFVFSAEPSAWLASRSPRPGDIVELRPVDAGAPTLVKRVLAVGPATVEVRDKRLIVGGSPRDVPFAHWDDVRIYPNSPFLEDSLRYRDNLPAADLAAGELFALGDNRDYSFDSRMFGAVDDGRVIGRPFLRVWSASFEASTAQRAPTLVR